MSAGLWLSAALVPLVALALALALDLPERPFAAFWPELEILLPLLAVPVCALVVALPAVLGAICWILAARRVVPCDELRSFLLTRGHAGPWRGRHAVARSDTDLGRGLPDPSSTHPFQLS